MMFVVASLLATALPNAPDVAGENKRELQTLQFSCSGATGPAFRANIVQTLSASTAIADSCTSVNAVTDCACSLDSATLTLFAGLASKLNTAALPEASTLDLMCASTCLKQQAVSKLFVHEMQKASGLWSAIPNSVITECLCADTTAFKTTADTQDPSGLASVSQCSAVVASLAAATTAPVKTSSDCSSTLGSDDPCFPSAAMVTRSDGTPARLDSVREGDAIVAATADGTLTTGTVSSLSTSKPEAEATFVKLKTTSAMELTLTPEHHLPVGEECCSNLKKAKDVAVNERVWAVRDGAVVADTVEAKAATIEQGLHSPVLTNGAFPVVDGVVTSFDRIESVTLASYLLEYAEPLLKNTGLAALLRSSAAEAAPLDAVARAQVVASPLASCGLAK